MLIELELSRDSRHPLCFLVWEETRGDKTTAELRCIHTSRSLAEKRVRWFNAIAKKEESTKRYYIEEAEMDHLFGSSVLYEFKFNEKLIDIAKENLRLAGERHEQASWWQVLDVACDPMNTYVDLRELAKEGKKL